MTTNNAWPLVDPLDDGIRPAGSPDECFYCRQRVGSPHASDCVIVTKRIEMRATAKVPSGETLAGLWQFDEPHSWDASSSEFHKNESSWCAANFLAAPRVDVVWDDGDAWDALVALDGGGNRLCGVLSFAFVRVVDPTPRRAVRSDGGAS